MIKYFVWIKLIKHTAQPECENSYGGNNLCEKEISDVHYFLCDGITHIVYALTHSSRLHQESITLDILMCPNAELKQEYEESS